MFSRMFSILVYCTYYVTQAKYPSIYIYIFISCIEALIIITYYAVLCWAILHCSAKYCVICNYYIIYYTGRQICAYSNYKPLNCVSFKLCLREISRYWKTANYVPYYVLKSRLHTPICVTDWSDLCRNWWRYETYRCVYDTHDATPSLAA